MSDEPNGAGDPPQDASTDGEANAAAPSTQETEVENETQEEASPDDLLSEAQGASKEEKPDAKPVDDKAKADFQQKDESVRLDAQLLKSEGKSNLEIIAELKDSGLHSEAQINRLKKLMATGKLEETATEEEPESEKDRFRKWQAEENTAKEKDSSLKWFAESYAKELGINAKTNSVAIETRKKLLAKANTIYSQTSPEHRNFKDSLETAAAVLGLNNKAKTKEAIKKAVKTARTSVNSDTGEPQKITKTTYTVSEFSALKKSNPEKAKSVMRQAIDKKIKIISD